MVETGIASFYEGIQFFKDFGKFTVAAGPVLAATGLAVGGFMIDAMGVLAGFIADVLAAIVGFFFWSFMCGSYSIVATLYKLPHLIEGVGFLA